MVKIPDKDCNKEFPYRSKIVIDKKKYDQYCLKDKVCSEWNDSLTDENNNPVPWPEFCGVPPQVALLPIIERGTICEEIKKSLGSVKDIKQSLEVFKQQFRDISSNYVDKYATYMKYPSDDNKKEMAKYEQQWLTLQQDLIKERNNLNKLSKDYSKRVKGMSEVLDRDELTHNYTTANLNEQERKLLSMAGKDMKDNMYNNTSSHITQTIYYTTAIIVMGIFLRKLN